MKGVEWNESELDALLDAAAADLTADGQPQPSDDALVARSVAGAVAKANAGPYGVAGRGNPWTRRGVLLAAAVLAVAGGAFALMRQAHAPDGAIAAPPRATVAAPAGSSAQTAASPAEVDAEHGPNVEPVAAPPPPLPATPSLSPEPGARELFAQANETRRQGDVAGAAHQYVALEKRYPHSPEARLSLVALGRLYLDRLGDPRRALAQFEEYLSASGDGELREEAMVGRALALQRLGRSAEEKAAWKALLAAFPSSLSADRANERLTELH